LSQVTHRQLVQKLPKVPSVSKEVSVVQGGYRYSNASLPEDMRPPTLGQHTDEVLRELGYGAEQIQSFRTSGAV
jgi:crotonobetainyl-CoA:carnitine CoA-transferase CaiB-like acyl-CoA transferase